MKKAIVRLKPDLKINSGYITLNDSKRNHYTIEKSKGFIELPPDAAKRIESDPRITVEYPCDTPNDNYVIPDGTPDEDIIDDSPGEKKYTKTEIVNMNKNEQINLLKKIGSKLIPKKEKGRVEMILRLQKG